MIVPDPTPQKPAQTKTLPFENIGRFAPLFYSKGDYTYFDDYARLPATLTPDLFSNNLVFRDQLGARSVPTGVINSHWTSWTIWTSAARRTTTSRTLIPATPIAARRVGLYRDKPRTR